MTLVDVRGGGDFALGHISGSRWVARGSLELRIAEEVPNPGAEVVTVCDTGVRSTLAAARLQSLGYATARVLEGGLDGWQQAGLPLEEDLQGARVSLEEAKGDVETARRRGILARSRADMEEYLRWEEELGKDHQAHP